MTQLLATGANPVRHDKHAMNLPPAKEREHTLWMAIEAQRLLKEAQEQKSEKRRQKVHRWLGWIQAKMHTLQMLTVADARDHNREPVA